MLKVTGLLFVFTASIGLAYQIGLDLKNHLLLLYDMRKLLFDIANEMTYSSDPAEQIFLSMHSRNAQLNEICARMGTELRKKESPRGSEVWKASVELYREKMHLTDEETEIFAGAGSSFFGKSIPENEKGLEHYIARLDEVIRETGKERKEKQKVYQTASIMCGLIVILLFL